MTETAPPESSEPKADMSKASPISNLASTSEKFGLGFNIGGICAGLLIIVAGICNMVWNTGSPQRIILGIYFLVAGAFGAVVEVMEVKLLVKWAPLMQTYIGRGLFYIFWGILVAAVGGVAWVIFGIIMIVFGFLLIFIPPCVIKDYHLGPYYLNGTARHSIDILNAEGASIDQVKDAWAKEKKRADGAEARFTKAEKDLAEARAELTLAETRGTEKA